MDYTFYVDFKHYQSNSEENPASVCVLAVRSNLIFFGVYCPSAQIYAFTDVSLPRIIIIFRQMDCNYCFFMNSMYFDPSGRWNGDNTVHRHIGYLYMFVSNYSMFDKMKQ